MNIAVIRQNGSVTLVKGGASDKIDVAGELFVPKNTQPEWFGFYDWLRTSKGEVIGVRLQLDSPLDIDAERLNLLYSLDARNSADELYIFFGPQREFDAEMSDDADFGRNILYIGQLGSVAISFNSAACRGASGDGDSFDKVDPGKAIS
ncbi:hypothetical protein RBA41_08215 [Massilia sp. CCM 9210]|uniref:hypothetical protein n=1 Tax=Massilia scottii TaxID=3057166 RepID=UPI002796ACD0|nr:hypothetical protein [Massilia sp. CCM 9210]MDQ1813286.1 hypothetical protein [Massilia sp. CCM 9210]